MANLMEAETHQIDQSLHRVLLGLVGLHSERIIMAPTEEVCRVCGVGKLFIINGTMDAHGNCQFCQRERQVKAQVRDIMDGWARARQARRAHDDGLLTLEEVWAAVKELFLYRGKNANDEAIEIWVKELMGASKKKFRNCMEKMKTVAAYDFAVGVAKKYAGIKETLAQRESGRDKAVPD